MGGTYGTSYAAKLIAQGSYEDAVAEATREAMRDADDPEPLFERATALSFLSRFGDAVADFERAMVLDRQAQLLDTSEVDDACFSALLALAREDAARSVDDGVARLARYLQLFPEGAHVRDVAHWTRILRGEVQREFVKER